MRDPFNPTPTEIRTWAYTKKATEPEQDWDLHLANLREFDLYIELAGDDDCPTRDYFLRLLYLIIGDAVRSGFRSESEKTIRGILAKTKKSPDHRFIRFRRRATELLNRPDLFNYDDWCLGRFVVSDLKKRKA